MINPETQPFDAALSNMRGNSLFRDALVEVGDSVEMSKKILLQNRVRDFGAADVLVLTKLILDRELELRQRSIHEGDDQGVF